MRFLTFLARRFVAGDTIDEAKVAVKRLNDMGLQVTLDVLGENVTNRQEAEQARDAYLNVLDVIDSEKLNSNVSLKLTQMGLDLDPSFCADNLRKIVNRARDLGNFVRVDMEGSPYTQKTMDLFKEVYNDYKGHVGIVIQSYLYRSDKDVELLNGLSAPVRLCKGAYKESPEIAFRDMKAIRINFMALSINLLENGSYPAFGTHDKMLISQLRDYARKKGVNKDKFEFQMLYGIRRKLSKRLSDEGYRVRIYVPFGRHWLPYLTRRLRERKENLFFIMKNLFTD